MLRTQVEEILQNCSRFCVDSVFVGRDSDTVAFAAVDIDDFFVVFDAVVSTAVLVVIAVGISVMAVASTATVTIGFEAVVTSFCQCCCYCGFDVCDGVGSKNVSLLLSNVLGRKL